MGRRKIEIRPLADERSRQVTFLKRKKGLFRKAHQLSVLCSVDIAIVIIGPKRRLFEFSSNDNIDQIIHDRSTLDPYESKCSRDYDSSTPDRDDDDTDLNSYDAHSASMSAARDRSNASSTAASELRSDPHSYSYSASQQQSQEYYNYAPQPNEYVQPSHHPSAYRLTDPRYQFPYTSPTYAAPAAQPETALKGVTTMAQHQHHQQHQKQTQLDNFHTSPPNSAHANYNPDKYPSSASSHYIINNDSSTYSYTSSNAAIQRHFQEQDYYTEQSHYVPVKRQNSLSSRSAGLSNSPGETSEGYQHSASDHTPAAKRPSLHINIAEEGQAASAESVSAQDPKSAKFQGDSVVPPSASTANSGVSPPGSGKPEAMRHSADDKDYNFVGQYNPSSGGSSNGALRPNTDAGAISATLPSRYMNDLLSSPSLMSPYYMGHDSNSVAQMPRTARAPQMATGMNSNWQPIRNAAESESSHSSTSDASRAVGVTASGDSS
ncbi:hypothetical protein CANCADRAFT_46056 [Tortispora caseinolytica NRRL Y-17796]|uniref:MADS-box domain-containing protein n=1 Tax=Tortispora caseinolytica NRRL Y-17796 TaxID=767744 RepID=A0A1E4TD03_9ASCO|nr:hypothetical protein CANCADRAFT_46056 [Tortispora caseinolytica NRRL Y-17796]